MKNIFFKPIFWLGFLIISGASALLTVHYFPLAHSIITVPITMDRNEAIIQATNIARQHSLEPANGNSAVNFQTDYLVQFFVELDAGGKEAFTQMIEQNLYQPYTWQIRFFKEHLPEEALVQFTPNGKPYGFQQKFSENASGAQLSAQEAQIIAEQGAREWNIDLSLYALIEKSKETVPSGRIDHTFVYERPKIKIGEGFYRLRIQVAGEKLSELTHFVQVPETFIRKYTEMRSANEAIAYYAKIALVLLYFLGGCLFGLFFLVRRRYIIWRAPIIWGLIFVALTIGTGLNQLPLAWMNYDTAISSNSYLLQYILSIVINACAFGIFFTLIFAAAESLTRAAFGNHIQFWRIWDKSIANSYQVLGRTLAAYLIVPIDLIFATMFYLVMNSYFNWWNPSSSLFDPNILATQFPWFDPLAQSIKAGFWEECMFRAVPLSCAALIGNRYGKKNWWIGGALILQALVFGAGHANYPAQPAIARVIELFIPSMIFGGLYLAFGLLPAILSHILYDIILFALPLFAASGHYAYLYQAILIAFSLIPIWIILIRRFQLGAWISLPSWGLNRSWQAPDEDAIPLTKTEAQTTLSFNKQLRMGIISAGILASFCWYFAIPHKQQAAPMQINRATALNLTNQAFAQATIDHTKSWSPLLTAFTNFDTNGKTKYQHRFIWQLGGVSAYQQLLGTYLQSPFWYVRYAQFEGPILDREEEITIALNNQAKVFRIVHHLPENRPGKELSEQEARILAHTELKNKFGLDAQELKEISAIATKRPARKDWTFIFADEKIYPLNTGQARIKIEISGDQLTDYQQYIQVPEEWERQEKNNETNRNSIMLICLSLIYIIFCAGSVFAVAGWANKLSLGASFFGFFIFIAGIELFVIFNNYSSTIASNFNTAQPFQDQWIRLFGTFIFKAFFMSAVFALLIAYINRFKIPTRIKRLPSNAWIGLSIGAIFAGTQALILHVIPPLKPLWANYESMDAWSPLLEGIGNSISSMITLTLLSLLLCILIDFVTKHGTQKKGFAFGIFLLFGFAINGIQFAENIPLAGALGCCMGVLLFCSYYFVFRFDFALIPVAVTAFLALQYTQQAMYYAFPATEYLYPIATIVVSYIAFQWYKTLN